MARTAIVAEAITDTGFNLTDTNKFTTLATGSGNGVEFPQDQSQRIVLKNAAGSTATVTVKIPTPAQYSSLSLALPDMTLTIDNGKTFILEPHPQFRQSDGNVYIDCDKAIDILVLAS